MPHLPKPFLLALMLALGCAAAPLLADPTPTDTGDKATLDLCASRTGDARDACLREAQDRQISSDVRADVRADSKNSRYKAARAKCDVLSGSAKDDCIAAAKAKFKP